MNQCLFALTRRWATLAAMALLSLGGFSRGEDAFVRLSPRDSRYFELSDGRPYVPIGLNMIAPPRDGGLETMEAWFGKLSEAGGNYVRIWLGHQFFDVEHARSGQYDPAQAERIDRLLEIARRHGIRLKLCLEHFRHLGEGRKPWFGKPLHHVSQGGPAGSTAEFFDKAECREQFRRKLDWLADRYGDDPIVFGWELWNEVDCIRAGDWRAWTEAMLPELHRRFPRNLAMQSLGSFDNASKRRRYADLCAIAGNDVHQVHRYLDLGASLQVCHGPMDVLAADSVRELLAFDAKRPVLLAEGGAVEPSHTGPFKLYAKDSEGIILHDVLFAPFFAGAAGPGQIWHWDVYVNRLDLWHQFARFAEIVDGIDPPAEQFEPQVLPHERLRVLALQGRHTLLVWCRDRENTWKTELAEGRPPERIEGASLAVALPADWSGPTDARAYGPWTDRWTPVTVRDGRMTLPAFSRSIVVRVGRR